MLNRNAIITSGILVAGYFVVFIKNEMVQKEYNTISNIIHDLSTEKSDQLEGHMEFFKMTCKKTATHSLTYEEVMKNISFIPQLKKSPRLRDTKKGVNTLLKLGISNNVWKYKNNDITDIVITNAIISRSQFIADSLDTIYKDEYDIKPYLKNRLKKYKVGTEYELNFAFIKIPKHITFTAHYKIGRTKYRIQKDPIILKQEADSLVVDFRSFNLVSKTHYTTKRVLTP